MPPTRTRWGNSTAQSRWRARWSCSSRMWCWKKRCMTPCFWPPRRGICSRRRRGGPSTSARGVWQTRMRWRSPRTPSRRIGSKQCWMARGATRYRWGSSMSSTRRGQRLSPPQPGVVGMGSRRAGTGLGRVFEASLAQRQDPLASLVTVGCREQELGVWEGPQRGMGRRSMLRLPDGPALSVLVSALVTDWKCLEERQVTGLTQRVA